MELMGQVFRVKPEKKAEYIRAHAELWPEMKEDLRKAGVRMMTIWERDNVLFLFTQLESVEWFFEYRKTSEVYHRWEAWMKELLVEPFDEKEPGVIWAQMQEVFHFEAGA